MKKINTKWNLSKLFKDEPAYIEEYEAEVTKATEQFVAKWSSTDYVSDAKVLKEALDEYCTLLSEHDYFGREMQYLGLLEDLDQENTTIKARINKLHTKSVALYNTTEFFKHRISTVASEKQKNLLESPVLSEYKHFLEICFGFGKHWLSEAEEKIMNIKSKTSSRNWVQMVSDFIAKQKGEVTDSKGNTSTKSFAEIMSSVNSTDKVERDSAAKLVHKINADYADMAAYELNSILENKFNDDTLRGYTRPDQARHMSDDIESSVVDTLVQTVSANFDISQEYYKLKAKYLGVDKLEYHERNVPIGDVERKYSIEDGVKLVGDSLGALDPEFEAIFNGFIEEELVDFLPKSGKRNGAYCSALNNKDPIYILMNYTEKLNDILTLAHEVGHGIHFTLSREQNELNYGASLATAEVASTFMEDFVLERVEQDLGENEAKMLIMARLNDDISTIFRQVACYNFETELHATFREKGFLSAKEIGEIFTKHMKSYMGDAVKYEGGAENWWVYWSHIRSFFYVYSYSSGLLISKALQAIVRANPADISKVKQFMKAGRSQSPLNIFKDVGFDISQKEFWLKGLQEVRDTMQKAA